MCGLFIWNLKKIFKLITLCFPTKIRRNERKHGLRISANFTIDPMISWLQDDYIETLQTHNEENIDAAKTFIRNLKGNITNTWLSYQKNVWLHEIANKYNNTYPSPIKMEPFYG